MQSGMHPINCDSSLKFTAACQPLHHTQQLDTVYNKAQQTQASESSCCLEPYMQHQSGYYLCQRCMCAAI
jgi:hypothetical protein